MFFLSPSVNGHRSSVTSRSPTSPFNTRVVPPRTRIIRMDAVLEQKSRCSAGGRSIPRVLCDGYVYFMSDGSRFLCEDVETVKVEMGADPSLSSTLATCSTKRKRDDDDGAEESDFYFHMCDDDDDGGCVPKFPVSYKCNAWCRLADTQRDVLKQIQDRVDLDRAERRYFSCVIIEGPGGCGKTRLMSHIMNHHPSTSMVFYVTKQNKRVQDFVHNDCLSGETDPSVQKPFDLTPKHAREINRTLANGSTTGRYALTAEKFILALCEKTPRCFGPDATVESLGIDYRIFNTADLETEAHVSRNIVILLDEYTMLQPPLIHAIAYYVRCVSRSPVLLVMGGDRFQNGPVGFDPGECYADEQHFTGDVRQEFLTKMKYAPLEIKMENLQRCRDDPALTGCIERLRKVCEDEFNRREKVNLVLARYSDESGVKLYRRYDRLIRRVVPANSETKDEELDERGVDFETSSEPPTTPEYDLLPLVSHFTNLITKLAEISYPTIMESHAWQETVCDSAVSIRDLLPVFIVLTNSSCNEYAERFLLALSTKVRERVQSAPVPTDLDVDEDVWTEHVNHTLRRCIRCLSIDEDDAIQRQTLLVGMVYKMTSTFNRFVDPSSFLCNGETVVLTSIGFCDNSLERMREVTLRKFDGRADATPVLRTGFNTNRMTGEQKRPVMPFVPYVTENIYQMQGNTMPKSAKCFVDLTGARPNSVYVAVSRFQNSASIEAIVLPE
ncbi:hypothetical protein J6590_099270 [Homalodisca vitripennis]|nr:hypothetical protein J6590_099270 [Homalodisca vitripennis]